ncbi:MAG: hypothetical protein ACXACA_06930 [Candidatus Ranarchaeia archaeon]
MSSKSELELRVESKYSFGEVVPELDVRNEFWSYGEFELVGHGRQTNSQCGKFKNFSGCLRIDLHNQVRWFFPDLKKDAVFVKSVYYSCDKPTCPTCYKFGWAVREASRMEDRLKKASNRFGLIEHIVVSVPDREYGLSLESLRKKCVKILRARGVIGGCMIFHAFRYRNSKVARKKDLPVRWFWSPHFHVVGFVGGEGYGKCRKCASNPKIVHNWNKCKSCNGFEGLTRRYYEKEGGRSGSGYIVKVLGERKTIGGTAWYQLNHASVRRGKNSKKSHVATWFGVCSYRKLKLINGNDVGIKHKCPICSCDLVRVRYLGVFSEHSIPKRGQIMSLFGDDGQPIWEVVTEKRFEGG